MVLGRQINNSGVALGLDKTKLFLCGLARCRGSLIKLKVIENILELIRRTLKSQTLANARPKVAKRRAERIRHRSPLSDQPRLSDLSPSGVERYKVTGNGLLIGCVKVLGSTANPMMAL